MGVALAIQEAMIEPPARTQEASAASSAARPLRPTQIISNTDGATVELDKIGTPVVCRKGQSAVQEGDPAAYVYRVTSGTLRAVKLLPDGRRHIANFLMPGDFFGLADCDVHAHGLEAVSDSTLRKYPRRGFENFLEGDAQARRRLFAAMCKELSAIHEHLLLLGRKTATERLATFLLDLAERLAGGRGGTERGLELPMNRSDVADYLGLRIETVCRLLSELKNRRIIELIDMHRIRLLKREVLVEMSAGDCN